MTLPEPGRAAGGMSIAATDQAIRTIELRLKQDRALARQVRVLEAKLSIVETWP